MATAAVPLETTEFSTADPEVAREYFSKVYGEATLRVKQPLSENGIVHVRRVASPELSLSHLTVPSEIDATFAGRDGEVLVGTLNGGQVKIQRGASGPRSAARYGEGDVFIANCPGAAWRHSTAPLRSTVVGVSESLVRQATSSADTATRSFAPLAYEPGPGRDGLWHGVTTFLGSLLNEPTAASAPLVIGPASRLAASTMLLVFPSAMGRQLVKERRGPRPETLKRSIAYIEGNPQMDITIDDLAREARTSARSVQLAFRRHLDTTPTAYLRSVRLHHAREELLASDPEAGVRVTDIALRWGFTGASRFAGYYKREYGEKPSETLRR